MIAILIMAGICLLANIGATKNNPDILANNNKKTSSEKVVLISDH